MPRHDLVIIGAGPGGYVAAIRAAQLGLDVACIEKEPRLGGTCLRVGCIPSKALLESSDLYHESKTRFADHGIVLKSVELDLARMQKRKDDTVDSLTRGVAGLFKKNKVTRYEGTGKLVRAGLVSVATAQGEVQLECEHVILATGSVSATLKGVEVDLDRIATSTEALSWPAVPKHLVVIGAGVIGLELGSVWARLGARVTVLEYLDRILPGMDAELAKEAQRLFEKQGIAFLLGSRVTGAKATKKGALVTAEGRESVECDRVLLAVGRTPNTQGLGLSEAGVAVDRRGTVVVDDHFSTNLRGV
ncbi:MAG TPA: NAD(P)/FAD-dependent oxidoreductase, partial [Planctomycetota bacterium]|nr:NAD(P)/FAD-dependent oxidoreductase [Planctomycetota bacterium]